MKKFLVFLLSAATLFSCTDMVNEDVSVNDVPPINNGEVSLEDAGIAQKSFAKILSKAVYDNIELRQFLKDKAIEQFDNDHDVFYPFVKDEIVVGNQTFRDILLSYSSEKELSEIEATLPLLNILLPDLSFLGSSKPEEWDVIDNEVPVAHAIGNENQVLYCNGDSIMKLSPNEIPGFPVLVVKNNERMKIAGASRASNGIAYTYDFIDDAFNGSLRTPQSRGDWVNTYPLESDEAYVSADELDPEVIKAYEESKKNSKAIDRDYIYYGLSSQHSQNGVLNTYMREELYKFKIDAKAYFAIAEQDGDPQLNNGASGSTWHKKTELDKSQIISNIWKQGNFEIYFACYVGARDAATQPYVLPFSVTPNELFQIDKIKVHRRHHTGLRHTKYTYTVDAADLKSRWVSVRDIDKKTPVYIFPESWDAYNKSLIINMAVYERDDSQTITRDYSVTEEYSVTTDFSATSGSGKDNKTTIKAGIGFTSTRKVTKSIKVVTQKESDDLGTISYNFLDPIILSDAEKSTKGYKIQTVTNGTVEVMILPRRIR